MGTTPLSLYLKQMGVGPADAIDRFYSATVDAPCLSCEQDRLLTMIVSCASWRVQVAGMDTVNEWPVCDSMRLMVFFGWRCSRATHDFQ